MARMRDTWVGRLVSYGCGWRQMYGEGYHVTVTVEITEGAPAQIGRRVEIVFSPDSARRLAESLNKSAADADKYQRVREGK